MELADRFSIYKRGEPLTSHRTSSNAARGLASRLKRFQTQRLPRAPHIRCPQTTFRHLSHPNFSIFRPFFKNFLPNRPGTVRRALNRLAAPSRHPKTPEFRGKTPHSRLATAPKSPAKHPSRTPKTPPLTPLHIKKLSKVRSTLLTPPPRECILEYMRLKEPRRPPHTEWHAQYRPPPQLSNYPASH